MNLLFATESFRNECNNQEQLVKKYGAVRARLIRQRLDELFNAEVLDDMRSLPHVSIQTLHGGSSDLAVEVGSPYWLVFRPETLDGGRESASAEWKKVDSIRILDLIKADEQRIP